MTGIKPPNRQWCWSPFGYPGLCPRWNHPDRVRGGGAVMSACLIDRFFTEEFNDHVKAVVEEAAAGEEGARYLVFNVFNVAIDLDGGFVTVEDELDASAECTVSLASFLERVQEGSIGS